MKYRKLILAICVGACIPAYGIYVLTHFDKFSRTELRHQVPADYLTVFKDSASSNLELLMAFYNGKQNPFAEYTYKNLYVEEFKFNLKEERKISDCLRFEKGSVNSYSLRSYERTSWGKVATYLNWDDSLRDVERLDVVLNKKWYKLINSNDSFMYFNYQLNDLSFTVNGDAKPMFVIKDKSWFGKTDCNVCVLVKAKSMYVILIASLDGKPIEDYLFRS